MRFSMQKDHAMEPENSTQEAAEIIDLVLLCEHCPFASKIDGGAEQKMTQGKEQKQQVDARQMTLPFAREFDAHVAAESDASNPQKQRDEAMQTFVINYLMQEHFWRDHDAAITPQSERDDEQKSDPHKHAKTPSSERDSLLLDEREIPAQETVPSDAEKQTARDAKNTTAGMELRAYHADTDIRKQRPAQNTSHRTQKQGRDAER